MRKKKKPYHGWLLSKLLREEVDALLQVWLARLGIRWTGAVTW